MSLLRGAPLLPPWAPFSTSSMSWDGKLCLTQLSSLSSLERCLPRAGPPESVVHRADLKF
eukprot:4606223-Amphidinium_carterae.2